MLATLVGLRRRIGRVFSMRSASLMALILLVGACGEDPPTLIFDPATDPTASNPSTSTGPGDDELASPTIVPGEDSAQFVVGDTWVDATSNLAGIESYCGNLSFVSARPDRDQVFASVVGQGLFSNESGSTEWVPIGREPGSAPVDHRTSGFVYDPDNPEIFWESGYFSLGPPPDARASSVNRTDDGGQTFVAVGNELPADLVSVDLSDPDRQTLLVGLRGSRTERVLRSADGGTTWSDVTDGLPASLGEASFPHVVDANTYLLGTHKGDRGASAAPGIFRTTDAGGTWTKVFEEGVSGPPLVSTDGLLYWLLDEGGVISSSDEGASWTVISSGIPMGAGGVLDARRNRIVETSTGAWLALDIDDMVISVDRGVSWSRIGPPLPVARPAGFTYSEIRGAVYLWSNYCDFVAGANPVAEESIYRLDLDLSP